MLSRIRPARKHLVLAAALLATPVGATLSARAQTPALPDAMNTEISDKCLAAAKDIFKKPRIALDPAGSASFGLAVLFGKAAKGNERISLVCVFDKATGKVELGSAMGTDILRVRGPKKDGAGGTDDDED